jgi:hypothetical protein
VDVQRCCRCGVEKPLDAFYVTRRGYRWKRCTPCHGEVKRASVAKDPKRHRAVIARGQARYRAAHPDRVKASDWKQHLRVYGLTPELYDEMRAAQGGMCAICSKAGNRRLAVDHDHVTGRVRGLLCDLCNKAIGALGDTAEGVMRAVAYLKRGEA